MKCLGLPHGPKLPFQEKLIPVQAHRPSPPTPRPMPLGLQEMEARKALSTTPAPNPAWSHCSVSARRWLHSWLCPVMLHQPLSGSAAGRPDYLSNAQNLRWAAAPLHPRHRAREQCSSPRSHGAAQPTEGPRAVPPRPGSPAGNQPVWPWRWTFLYYCEVLFMKNLEGESARPREMWCSSFPFPHSSKIPPPSATHHPPTQGTPMPVTVPLRNPALPACLLLQGLSRPAWAPVKGWSEPSGVLGDGRRRMPPHIRVETPGKGLRDQLCFLNKRGLVFSGV